MRSILDPDFKYRPSHDTDITSSRNWEKAKKKLEEDKARRDELRKKIEQIPTIGRARKV